MAQRTVMRMNLAQLRAVKGEDEETTPSASFPRATAEASNIIYYLTIHIINNIVPTGGLIYLTVFGPCRSHQDVLLVLATQFPRTAIFLDPSGEFGNLQMEKGNHFRWEEEGGNKVLLRVEQVRNAAVHAAGKEADVFTIIHRVTRFDYEPPSETGDVVGVCLEQGEASHAALMLFREDIEGQHLGGCEETVKEDGLLFCRAQSSGEGGYRWTVEVERNSWARV